MVATSAFGIGLDTPHVRVVFHIGFCRSMLDYSQERGRVGRDGNPARCVTVYNDSFSKSLTSTIENEVAESICQIGSGSGTSFAPRDSLRRMSAALSFSQFCGWASSSLRCRRVALSEFLDEEACAECSVERSSSWCVYCLSILNENKRDEPPLTQKGTSPVLAGRPGSDMEEDEGNVKHIEPVEEKRVGDRQIDVVSRTDLFERRHEKQIGSSTSNQIALSASKKTDSKRLAEFHDNIEILRNMCVLCYGRDKTLPEENRNCIRKSNACFKCLRPARGSAGCPTLCRGAPNTGEGILNGATARGKEGNGVKSLLGFRSATAQNRRTNDAQASKRSTTKICWDSHLPLQFKTHRLHKGNEFGWKNCLIRRTVPLLLVFGDKMISERN